jgi:hypothetical protein
MHAEDDQRWGRTSAPLGHAHGGLLASSPSLLPTEAFSARRSRRIADSPVSPGRQLPRDAGARFAGEGTPRPSEEGEALVMVRAASRAP